MEEHIYKPFTSSIEKTRFFFPHFTMGVTSPFHSYFCCCYKLLLRPRLTVLSFLLVMFCCFWSKLLGCVSFGERVMSLIARGEGPFYSYFCCCYKFFLSYACYFQLFVNHVWLLLGQVIRLGRLY